jgi:hypothetical protein
VERKEVVAGDDDMKIDMDVDATDEKERFDFLFV